MNNQIKARELRVIDSDGAQLGVISFDEAMKIATEQRLDLVMVSPQASPPVCKILNYGKYKYEQSKREREARKKQHIVNLKEIRLSPTIEENDLMTKARAANKFLEAGNKVKLTVRFRGRQIVHSELGKKVLIKLGNQLQEFGKPDSKIKMEGRNMTVVYSPLLKK
ncbi:translation initiation factor IF-3 [Clostridium sp. 'deep sea']|uniref:translation initiation factor IF-3 n=1 Tax=Clostridium sp. 'deep sea' TaxID=2779445 RepID=UPI00325FB4CE